MHNPCESGTTNCEPRALARASRDLRAAAPTWWNVDVGGKHLLRKMGGRNRSAAQCVLDSIWCTHAHKRKNLNLTFLRLGLAPSTVARKRIQNMQISKPMRTENIAVTRILSVPKTYAVCLCAPTRLPPARLRCLTPGSVYLFRLTPFFFRMMRKYLSMFQHVSGGARAGRRTFSWARYQELLQGGGEHTCMQQSP